MYRLLADLTVLLHFGFILFALVGGVLVSRWRKLAWLHLPCMGWIALNQFLAWKCPLTLVEKFFNQRAGMAEYQGGFISHHVAALLGPEGEAEPVGGFLIIALNGILYWWIVQNSRKLVKEKNHAI